VVESVYQHVEQVMDLPPRRIAEHLRRVHKVEPIPARKGYERSCWFSQHEREHYPGINGFVRERPLQEVHRG